MKRLLLALLLVLLAVVPARADEAARAAAAALRSAPVYQAPGLDLVDVGTLMSELAGTDPPVYVAVLPATAAATAKDAQQRAVEIGDALAAPGAVVLVVTANRHFGSGQGSAAAARGVDAGEALEKEVEALKSFTKDDLTLLVISFAERVANQTGTGTAEGSPVDTGGGSGAVWLLVLTLVVLLGAGALAVRRLRRRGPQAEGELGTDILG